MNFVKVRVSGKGKYNEVNKPFFDFNQMIANSIFQQNASSSMIAHSPTSFVAARRTGIIRSTMDTSMKCPASSG